MGFLCGSAHKESACNKRDLGSIPRFGRPPGERKGYPLQYSGLENSVDSMVHKIAESDMTEQLSLSNIVITNFQQFSKISVYSKAMCECNFNWTKSFLSFLWLTFARISQVEPGFWVLAHETSAFSWSQAPLYFH